MDRSRADASLALLPLLASMVSLCIGTSFAKTIFPVAGPAGTTALRIGLSAAVIVVAMRPWRWRIGRAALGAAAAYGVVLACMNLCFYAALSHLPLGIAIAIEFMGPLALAAWHSGRWRDGLWVALAAIGVAVLVLPGATGGAPVSWRGAGLALLAGAFWAAYIVLGKRATRLLPPQRILCLGLAVAALVAVPVGVVQAGAALWQPRVLASGAVVALLSSLLPYFLELVAMRRLTTLVFGIGVSMEPAIGALAAAAILGERLGHAQLLGIAAVTLASLGSATGAGPAPAKDDVPPAP